MLETHTLPGPAPQPLPTATRIEAEAERRLRSSSSYVLRNVACQYQDGVLLLRGQLPSYHHKQIAQELVQQVKGVERIDNRIEVIAPDSSTWLG